MKDIIKYHGHAIILYREDTGVAVLETWKRSERGPSLKNSTGKENILFLVKAVWQGCLIQLQVIGSDLILDI